MKLRKKLKQLAATLTIVGVVISILALVIYLVRSVPYPVIAIALAALLTYCSIRWVMHVERYENNRNNNHKNNEA